MPMRFRRFLLCALALALLSLSAAPAAMLAVNRGHFHLNCSCPVCAAIRDDLAVLHAVATALVVFLIFRVRAARFREAVARAAAGHRALLPVALKVRLND